MRNLTLIALAVIFSLGLNAQHKKELDDIEYRRSSLHTILIESENFPKKDTVINAYNKAPFPEKYNNHTIGEKSFNPLNYGFTTQKADKSEKKDKDSEEKELSQLQKSIDQYFQKEKIANKLVAKWFNRKEDGSFDMNLISERGFYDASDLETKVASQSARGIQTLGDTGEDLIKNTFVVVSKLNFVSNEIAALAIREAAYLAAEQLPNEIAITIAKKAADVVYKKAREGYSVWTTAYLYQLEWNDSIASVFYNDLWMSKGNTDEQKKAAFDNSDLFKLKFVGKEKATSLVTFSFKKGQAKRTDEQLIELATIRNIDRTYVKLQKNYDVFKTKTPIFSLDPVTAKIGMKEGLEGGEKFEVLEATLDKKTQKVVYVKKGIVTVDKKKIWDNRYAADSAEASKKGKAVTATSFKGGGKNIFEGMLLRLIK